MDAVRLKNAVYNGKACRFYSANSDVDAGACLKPNKQTIDAPHKKRRKEKWQDIPDLITNYSATRKLVIYQTEN